MRESEAGELAGVAVKDGRGRPAGDAAPDQFAAARVQLDADGGAAEATARVVPKPANWSSVVPPGGQNSSTTARTRPRGSAMFSSAPPGSSAATVAVENFMVRCTDQASTSGVVAVSQRNQATWPPLVLLGWTPVETRGPYG